MVLPKVVAPRKKRLGRGYGSGKGGHTSSRGQKGQKSRGTVNVLFEGVKMRKSFIKRLPLMRGKEKNKPYPKPVVVQVEQLEKLPAGTEVTAATLIENGFISKHDARLYGIKIVGTGKLTKKLSVLLPISKGAAAIVEKSGGKISDNAETK